MKRFIVARQTGLPNRDGSVEFHISLLNITLVRECATKNEAKKTVRDLKKELAAGVATRYRFLVLETVDFKRAKKTASAEVIPFKIQAVPAR